MRWNGRSWELRRAKGKTAHLGPKPADARLEAELKGAAGSFFLELPPPAEWLPAGLKLGEGTENAAIAVNTKSPASAQYMLAGAWTGDQIEYAWLAPNLTQDALDRQLQHLNQGNVPANVAMPLRTKAVKAGAGSSRPPYALTDYALRPRQGARLAAAGAARRDLYAIPLPRGAEGRFESGRLQLPPGRWWRTSPTTSCCRPTPEDPG